jgi:hypothetical protein
MRRFTARWSSSILSSGTTEALIPRSSREGRGPLLVKSEQVAGIFPPAKIFLPENAPSLNGAVPLSARPRQSREMLATLFRQQRVLRQIEENGLIPGHSPLFAFSRTLGPNGKLIATPKELTEGDSLRRIFLTNAA